MSVDKIAVELVAKVDGLQRDFAQAGNMAEQAGQRIQKAFSGYDALGMPIARSTREIAESSAKANQQMAGMGMSAKATAAAMRGVPAQFTDIVTSLQGGQKPLTVLLQQGGQLKDMFGGIGPAFSALGTYAIGLVNPFTVAAVAIGGLGYAAYAGAEESRALQKALIMTGNAAGVTAGQLQDVANSVAVSTGATKGAAAETLTQLVATGKVAAGSLDAAAASAIRMERAGGTAAEEMVKAFAALGKEPVEASIKLNDSYNYLTASTYRQIKALEDQGRTLEAVELAQKSFADASDGMAAKLEKNLGTIERGWRFVKDEVKKAGDAMLSIGRIPSLQEQLDAVENRIKSKDQIKNSRLPRSLSEKAQSDLEYAALKDQSVALSEAVQGEKAVSLEMQYQNELRKKGLDWEKDLYKAQEKTLSLDAKIAAQRRLGKELNRPQAEIDAVVAALEKQREKVPKSSGGSREQTSDYERGIIALQEKIAAKKEELSVTEKITAAEKEFAKFNAVDHPSLSKKELENTRAMYQEYIALDKQLEAKKQAKAFDSVKSGITELENSYSRDNQLKAAGMEIMPASQRELMRSILAIEEKAVSERKRYVDLQDRGIITEKQQIEATELLNAAIDRQKERTTALAAVQEKLNASFEYGAQKGLQSYLDSVANVAASSEALITNSFKGMEDALVSFVSTGKLDFKSLVNSIIADMARISIRQNITGPLAQWMQGGSSGGSSGGGLGGLFGFFSGLFGGGDMGSPRWDLNALGGVYSSPGLSAFSGQVVNRPTAFAFANGAGLMGEAGPEAILPLKRGSNGKLGVQSGGGRAVNITVHVNGNASAPDVRRAAGQGAREALAAFNGAGRYA